MVIDLSDLIPIATILGACSAPTLASIWAGRAANKSANIAAEKVVEVKETLVDVGKKTNMKLETIHLLVDNQLSQAVDRLEAATIKIGELELLLKAKELRRDN